ERIDSINGMDSFSGKAANEAKGYFNELHLTILESFRGLFDDLEENLKQHIQTFATEVDSSDSAVIESNYLEDVKEDINEIYEDLEKQDEIFHDTIENVADITSATSPDFSEVNEWKRKSVEKIKELDEDLASFTSKGDETDVKEIMNHIETVMNNAKTSEGKARFADFKGASAMKDLKKLMEYNNTNEVAHIEEITSNMYGESENGDGVKENEQLKQYINENVLTSEATINHEIEVVSEYLVKEQSSNGGYIDHHDENDVYVKLISYLLILNNYKAAINDAKENIDLDYSETDPLQARVESFESGFIDSDLEDEDSEDEAFRFYADSGITIHHYQGEDALMNRDEFLNRSWPEDKDLVYHNESQVEFFRGESAGKQLGYKQQLEDQETVDAANGQAVVQAIYSASTSATVGTMTSMTGVRKEASDVQKRIDLTDLKEASDDFGLDILLNHREPLGEAKTTD